MIFSSRPAFGHVFAMAPLARAARDAGHEVIFATGETFFPRLERWGFATAKVGEGIEWGFQQASARYPELLQPENPEFGGRMFVDVLAPRSFDDMTALIADTRPDVVVYEATDVGAAVAGAAAGVPIACHALSLWIEPFIAAIAARTRVFCDELGVDAPDVGVGDAFVDIWPPSMQTQGAAANAREHILLRPITWGDPDAPVPDWITTATRPLIFVSLGTVFWGKELLTKVIEALATTEFHALVLAGVDATPDDFPMTTDRLRLDGFVNQAEVLRRADVVIHHGGAGTMLGALARGPPALVLAEGADRPHTARSLAASGAGISLGPREATPVDIADAVTTLVRDGAYRDRARVIKQEIEAMPPPEDVVGRLEALVGKR